MTPIDPATARQFLEAIIAAFSIVGGGIAYASGYYAAQALVRDHSPELVTQRIGEGTGEGFMFVSPLSIVALIIMVWA